MSRLALCLFFIAIFHSGIVKVVNADETTTEGTSKTNEEVERAEKPKVAEKVEDEVPTKVEPQAKGVAPTSESKAASSIGDKDATNKVGNAEDGFLGSPMQIFKSIPIQNTQVLEFPKNALRQSTQAINAVGGQVGAALAQTFDTAKYIATAPFGFARSAVNSALNHE